MKDTANSPTRFGKFEHPTTTADGQPRARVGLTKPRTLWFNTGTLCNIACARCYIHSSPRNDALEYISADEARTYLDQIEDLGWPIQEIGFTGGEPFMNPEFLSMVETALERGYETLILTNAMRPMMRPRQMSGLLDLNNRFGRRLTLRISLDHHSRQLHDAERGIGAFDKTLAGMDWLRDNGFRMTVAGRTKWDETEADSRDGYAALYRARGYAIRADDPAQTVLFPEMDLTAETPEITTACWDILGKSPDDVMCASSRMVVKRKGAQRPTVLACTLVTDDPRFELGENLRDADTDVPLSHPHCAKFCVLGGASCSA